MKKNSEVDRYLAQKAHPMTAEIQRVREIILNNPGIQETIKSSIPAFLYKGNMALYFMNAKKHISPMFHKGAFFRNKSAVALKPVVCKNLTRLSFPA